MHSDITLERHTCVCAYCGIILDSIAAQRRRRRSSYPERRLPVGDLFWQHVICDLKTECWLWTAALWPRVNGYGQFHYKGETWKAHRVAWQLANGPLPADSHVLHTCDTPPCVNPAHLYLGGPSENSQDKRARNRHNPPVGERSRTARLRWELIPEIKTKRAGGLTLRALSLEYGVSISTIHAIVHNLSWRS